MKTMYRILSMVIVVGLIAAIPASTQILMGDQNETSENGNLPLLILVNRLELSKDQMDALDDILTGLIGEKESMEAATADLEQAMIEFNGTSEELDVMLAAFREDQTAAAEALRESVEGALDEVRDLLSINQGIVLQEVFPQLMGSIQLGADQDTVRSMDRRGLADDMGRGSRMSQQSPQGGQMTGPRGSGEEDCSGECEDDTLFTSPQGEFGDQRMGARTAADSDTMMTQHMGQNTDDGSGQADSRMGENSSPRDMMGQRGLRQPGASSLQMQRDGAAKTIDRDLFGLLEQITSVLEMKLEAME